MTLILPSRGFRRVERVSRLPLHWRARDGSLRALTGQQMQFSRASVGGAVVDANGRLTGQFPNGHPRFGMYDLDGDGVRESAALLLEGQRTNGWTYSEQLDNAAWSKTQCTITANATTAPDGAATADKIVESTSNSQHVVDRTVALAAGQSAVFSWHARAGERSWLVLRTFNDATAVGENSFVRLTDGAKGAIAAGHTLDIVALGDGWYRVMLAYTNGHTGTANVTVLAGPTTGDGTFSYTGDGASGIYAWGAMPEVGASFASSYKKTEGATVAQVAEQAYFDISGSTIAKPQAMTIYGRIGEVGWGLENYSALLRYGGTSGNRVFLEPEGGHYRLMAVLNGVTYRRDGSGTYPIGQVEFRAVVSPAEVTLGVAIAGGEELVSSMAGPATMPSAWSENRLYIFRNAFTDLKVALGEHSLDAMREAF